MSSVSPHYGDKYFAWQRSIGEFAGWADLSKFQDHVQPSDAVIDFGCGGGFLLHNLVAATKLGIEPNVAAHAQARQLGLEVVASTDEVPDGFADVVISNHALEHTHAPLAELIRLRPKLKPGGSAVFVVPCEGLRTRYRPNDINHHLYTWNPMCLGNLFTEAGYVVTSSEPYLHKWTPVSNRIARYGGRRLFDLSTRAYGSVSRTLSQVKIVARAPQ